MKVRSRPWCEGCAAVVSSMVEKSGINFQHRGPDETRPANLDDLHRRHSERGVAACLAVVDHRADLWLGDEHMQAYFRPSTLFRVSHFDEYLALAMAPKPRPQRAADARMYCVHCSGFGHQPIDCPRRGVR